MQQPPKPQSPPVPVVVVKEKKNDFYGVPKLALWIVLVNMVAWCVGVSLLYIAMGNPPAKIIYLMAGELIAMAFVLVLVFAWWKLFWWIMGCSFSCATALLFYALFGVATGVITTAFKFPNF
jgi:hypothetical protein